MERTGKIFPVEYGSERIFTASKQFRVLICLGITEGSSPLQKVSERHRYEYHEASEGKW